LKSFSIFRRRRPQADVWEQGGVRANAWVYSPLLIAKPGTLASPRSEMGLMHVTDMIPTLAGGLGGVPPAGGRPLDGVDVSQMLSTGSPSPRKEILHLIDPLGNGSENFTMANIAGCGGAPGTTSATHPPGPCEDSMAIRVGDYKLVVGQFARCGRNPMASEITQRMCGWWLPLSAPDNKRRTAEIAEARQLNINASWQGARLSGTAGPPVMVFHIPTDPNERNDLSTTVPAVVESLMQRLAALRKTEWLGPQWDTHPQSHNCDTGVAIGANNGSCQMRPDLYIEARIKKGCIDAYIPTAGAGAKKMKGVSGTLQAHIDVVSRKAGGSY
jgi:hypothetical protein